MSKYNPAQIEKKWQKYWAAKKVFAARENPRKKKKYVLIEFPYPSGEGLHMGHLRPYVAGDVYSRFMRLKGFETLYPIGWDAFGLPAENYAIKKGVHPSVSTKKNIANAKRQLQSWGTSFDWNREINTTDPDYYKWTQWLFLQFYKAGLAYEATGLINWCPKDKTGLANEEVIDGKCERCGSIVEKKELRQWYLKITAYADKLLKGLEDLKEWPDPVKLQQENWIGKSVGAEIKFEVKDPRLNFILLHGYQGSPEANFFPWLKRELESRGYKVQAPTLPNSADPIANDQVDFVLKNCTFDENTILLGHSFGGVVAMKVLEKLQRPIRKLVLGASFLEDKFKDHSRFGKDACDFVFNFDRIKENAKEIEILRDLSDTIVYADQADKLKEKLRGRIMDFTATEPHICGSSEPAVLQAVIDGIEVFTTRPDTICGATYMVVAPEHDIISNFKFQISNWEEVQSYINQAKSKQEMERTAEGKEKTGVELKGAKAINPATKEEIPVWVADYVLGGYGTGAIMAVPAHDERDFAFAQKFNLPIRQVVAPHNIDRENPPREGKQKTERNIIHAIVKHPTEDKIISLAWKNFPWKTLVTGGIEDGEDAVEAARREVREETGYKNLRFVKKLPYQIFAEFYAQHKDVNRAVMTTVVYFELENLDQDPVSEEEVKLHQVEWIPSASIGKLAPVSEMDHILRWLEKGDEAYTGDGILINSGEFSGMDASEALPKMAEKFGKPTVQYKLRDWVFSRQRYWGEPIPIIHCAECGVVPVPEKYLPVKLPNVKKYEPTGTGESPLAAIDKWVNTKCPKCKGPAKRETNTMPQWAGSSWYWLRYTDPKNIKEFASKVRQKYWTPVDVYFGGMEHTTLHLLYSRFWNLFLYDKKLVTAKEPYKLRKPHGIVLAADGEKMSKSRGNVVNPDDIIKKFGADTLRMYELFLGPHETMVSWNDQGVIGVRRFLDRVWNWAEAVQSAKLKVKSDSEKVQKQLHKLIKKVGEDIENFRFNTAISAFMEFHNEIKDEPITEASIKTFLKVLYPFAPHIAEEVNAKLGSKKTLQFEQWPKFNPKKIVEETVEIVVQVNGKVKAKLRVPQASTEEQVKSLALSDSHVSGTIGSQSIKRLIYIPNRLLNIVI